MAKTTKKMKLRKAYDAWHDDKDVLWHNKALAEQANARYLAEEMLLTDEAFYHGGLNGIHGADELIMFLERNEDWVCKMMGWVVEGSVTPVKVEDDEA